MNALYSKQPKQPSEKRIARIIEQKKVVVKKSWADSIPGETIQEKAFNALCFGVVIGHAGFIWFDCASLWSAPGFIAGLIAFMTICIAFILANNKTRIRTSGTAMPFAIIVDMLAFFVHYPTFEQWNGGNEILGKAVAAFVCACSAMALYIYRDEKLD